MCLGWTIPKIAATIGQHRTTIDRELKTNLHHQTYRPEPVASSRRKKPWNYSPHLAQERADERASSPKDSKLAMNQRLHDEVQQQLENKLSPEQIAARLRLDFLDSPEMWVSHETIYQSLYVQSRGALRRELTKGTTSIAVLFQNSATARPVR